MISDTTPEAEAHQRQIFQRMSGEERLLVSMALSDQMRDIALAGLKSKHPQATEDEIRDLFIKIVHGLVIKKEKGSICRGESNRFLKKAAQ